MKRVTGFAIAALGGVAVMSQIFILYPAQGVIMLGFIAIFAGLSLAIEGEENEDV